MENKRIIIIGYSASGKDHLANQLISKGFKKSTSYTTRPIRINETNGKVYNFVSLDIFKEMISENSFYEYECFLNNWYYGSTVDEWNNCNLFLKTVGGVKQITEKDRENCFIIFLDIPEEIRIKRLLKRNDNNDDIRRRIDADHKDFENFTNFDLKIIDESFNIDTDILSNIYT